jgi:hypothetical protein
MAGRRKAPKKKIEIVVVNGAAEKFSELDFLVAVATHPDIDERTKIVAVNTLASYKHPKPQLWVDKPIDLPVSKSAEEAADNVAKISALGRQKKISLDIADRLIAMERAFAEMKTATDVEAQMLDLRQQVAELNNRPARTPAVIIGGLPRLKVREDELPVIMPGDEDSDEQRP